MNYECYRYKFVIHIGSFFILIDWSQKYELCVMVILPKAIFFGEWVELMNIYVACMLCMT